MKNIFQVNVVPILFYAHYEKMTNDFSSICYKLQKGYPSNSSFCMQLSVAAKQADPEIFNITAADFYCINRTTTLKIFGAIVSYLIVIEQFSACIK